MRFAAVEDDPFDEPFDAAAPRYTPIGAIDELESQPGQLELVWTEPDTVGSGAIAGRVTGLPTVPATLATGSIAIEVDGIERPVVAGKRPPWRELESGMSGSDVVDVHRLLVRLGYAEGDPPDEVDWAFREAVQDYEEAFGWERTGRFRPEYVVWTPVDGLQVERFDVAVGDRIEPETQLAAGRASVSSTRLRGLNTGDPITVPEPFHIEVLGGPTFSAVDGELESGQLGAVADAGYLLAPGGDLPTELDVVVRSDSPTRLQIVPASAIVVASSDAQCVYLESGDAVEVTVVGGSGGVSQIEPKLDPNLMVLANPQDSGLDRCEL